MLRLQVWRFTCGRCGHVFDAPTRGFGQYALLRAPGTGEFAFIPFYDDLVFDSELKAIIQSLPVVREYESWRVALAFDDALSVVYDRASDGSPFVRGGRPGCPVCGWSEMSWSEEIVPFEWAEVEVPQATHHVWDGLSAEAKRALVEASVTEFLLSDQVARPGTT